jgi:putative membrane protein
MMGGWAGWGWMGPINMIFWLAILVILIAAAVWFVRAGSHTSDSPLLESRRSPGLDVLGERYARGEISREEYLQKKADIGG